MNQVHSYSADQFISQFTGSTEFAIKAAIANNHRQMIQHIGELGYSHTYTGESVANLTQASLYDFLMDLYNNQNIDQFWYVLDVPFNKHTQNWTGLHENTLRTWARDQQIGQQTGQYGTIVDQLNWAALIDHAHAADNAMGGGQKKNQLGMGSQLIPAGWKEQFLSSPLLVLGALLLAAIFLINQN